LWCQANSKTFTLNKTDMAAKQNSSTIRKEGEMTRSERTPATQQAESVLKSVKDVVHIIISSRTTIELPTHLSQEEIDARDCLIIYKL
jgi:hypothetical protein